MPDSALGNPSWKKEGFKAFTGTWNSDRPELKLRACSNEHGYLGSWHAEAGKKVSKLEFAITSSKDRLGGPVEDLQEKEPVFSVS